MSYYAVLQDKDIPSLLLVGAYRDDEVPETHPLALHVKDMERLGSTVTKIELGNLDEGAVKNLVAEALNMEDSVDKVEPLAGIVRELCGLVGRSTILLLCFRKLLTHASKCITSFHRQEDQRKPVLRDLLSAIIERRGIARIQLFCNLVALGKSTTHLPYICCSFRCLAHTLNF